MTPKPSTLAAILLACAALALPAAARARGSGGEFEKRRSSHFVLQQDAVTNERGGIHGSRRFEEQLLGELERAYDELGDWVKRRPPRRHEGVGDTPPRFRAPFARG